MESRAAYNNNPGNLRPPKGVTYEGQIGVDDKGFAIFETPDFGKRALRNDIKIKISKGVDTPDKFIDMYAPAGKDAYGDENKEDARINYKIFLANSLGLNSTGDKFSEDSIDKLADAIATFEGGERQSKGEQKSSVPFLDTEGKKVGVDESGEPPSSPRISPIFGGIAGGMLGYGAGATAALLKAKKEAAERAFETSKKILEQSQTPSLTPATTLSEADELAASRSGLLPSGEQHERAMQGNIKDKGITGRASQTTYNLRTQEIAEAAKEQAKILNELERAGKIPPANPYLPKVGSVASTASGVAIPAKLAMQLNEERAAAQAAAQTEAQAAAQAVPKGGLPPAVAYAARLARYPLLGGLAGIGFGTGAVEAQNQYYNERDKIGAALAGTGALASLAAPFVPYLGILPTTAIAAPLALLGRQGLKEEAKANIPLIRKFENLPAPTAEEIEAARIAGPAITRSQIRY